MNQKIKDYLGIALIIVAITFAFSVASYSISYSRSLGPLSLRSFTVDGEGTATAIPDIGQFTFGVTTEGGLDVSKLQEDNTEKMNSAISYLKDNGVDEKDIKTSNYSINPRYQFVRCGFGDICPPSQIFGYTIYQSVTVKVRNLNDAGKLLSGVVENGANNVSGLSFTIDDPIALENSARADAITQAENKAQAIADAGDFKLGKLLSIETISPQSPIYGIGGFSELRADSAIPSIEPGSEEIVARVILTYEIR